MIGDLAEPQGAGVLEESVLVARDQTSAALRRPILVRLSEVDNLQHAVSSFLRSNLPLDLEFKRLVQDIAHGEKGVELLFDSSDILGQSPD